MTKINKFRQLYDMHSHDESTSDKYLFELFSFLPHGYTDLIKEKALKRGLNVSNGSIRNIRSGLQKNIVIFNLLIETAKEYKAEHEKLKESLI